MVKYGQLRITCIIIIDYKNSDLPVIWASQDGANVIMMIVNVKVDLAILMLILVTG